SGVVSAPGLVEIFFGCGVACAVLNVSEDCPLGTADSTAIGTVKISEFVLVASTSSMLLVYATSWPSGEIAYISCPPNENGGTSWSPGVRSRGVFAFFCSGSHVGCDSEEGAGDTPASTVVVSAIASEGITNKWLRLNSVNAFQCR